jgi:hypothetical protein
LAPVSGQHLGGRPESRSLLRQKKPGRGGSEKPCESTTISTGICLLPVEGSYRQLAVASHADRQRKSLQTSSILSEGSRGCGERGFSLTGPSFGETQHYKRAAHTPAGAKDTRAEGQGHGEATSGHRIPTHHRVRHHPQAGGLMSGAASKAVAQVARLSPRSAV